MPPQPDFTLVLVGAAFLFLALSIYGNVLARLCTRGGKVRTSEFALPDLLVSIILAGTLIMIVVRLATTREEKGPSLVSISPEQVLFSQAFQGLLLFVGIAGFLRWRGVNVSRVLGLDRIEWPRALSYAAGLTIAAFPLVTAAGALVKNFLHDAAAEQELVTLFRDVTRNADYGSMIKIFAAGVIIAPLAEEFLFRGYFYGVFKRYLGGAPSALLTAALFAAFHLNLASLPSLFVLALCFTIAYEASGSLLVPMSMHALFNTTQLLLLYWQANAFQS